MRNNNSNQSLKACAICAVLMILIIALTNACSAADWNNGICPDCNVRYELRGASKALKYYACPKCGREVEKY